MNTTKKETVRQWKDRVEGEHNRRYKVMENQLAKIRTNCLFAVANADKEIRDFAQIILRFANDETL